MPKVLVIGLDGAEMGIIKPMMEAGDLPNIEKIVKNGNSNLMNSTIPPLSSPAWPSMITGKNPGKTGVFHFYYKKDLSSKNIELVNSLSNQAETIWEILSRHNKKVIVVSVPTTYPAKEVNGLLISGFLAPDKNSNFTYPKELKYQLPDDYEIDITKVKISGENAFFKKLTDVTQVRTDTMLKLMKENEWGFSMIVYGDCDRMQHFYWNSQDKIKTQYKLLDSYIGKFLDVIDDDTYVFIVSDHGFSGKTKGIDIFNWLVKYNWTTKKFTVWKYIGSAVKLGPFLLRKIWKNISFGERTKSVGFNLMEKALINSINWKKTRAYTLFDGYSININLKGREPEGIVDKKDFENTKKELIEQLNSIRDPETGKTIITAHDQKDIYHGNHTDRLPDIVLKVENEDYFIPVLEEYAYRKEIINNLKKTEGNHAQYGICFIKGKDIEDSDEKIEIFDIMPTILHIMGIPIPKDVDGKVLKGIFKKDSELYKRDVVFEEVTKSDVREKGAYSKEDEEKVKESLKKLGYL